MSKEVKRTFIERVSLKVFDDPESKSGYSVKVMPDENGPMAKYYNHSTEKEEIVTGLDAFEI